MTKQSFLFWSRAALGVLSLSAHGALLADCVPVSITSQPPDRYVEEGCPASFAVDVTGSEPIFYQWLRDNVIIPDATNSSYTIIHAQYRDSGSVFRVRAANSCSETNSVDASLALGTDVVPPSVLRARGDATLQHVIVAFAVGSCGWPYLNRQSAEDLSNYSISAGLNISNAVLDTTGLNVTLTTSGQTLGTIYTLTVGSVQDNNGNSIYPYTEIQFQAWELSRESGEVVPPPVSIRRDRDTVTISWPPGSNLQEAETLTGPWTTCLRDQNPRVTAVTNTARFYRAIF